MKELLVLLKCAEADITGLLQEVQNYKHPAYETLKELGKKITELEKSTL